jgi:hypothetical protein
MFFFTKWVSPKNGFPKKMVFPKKLLSQLVFQKMVFPIFSPILLRGTMKVPKPFGQSAEREGKAQ